MTATGQSGAGTVFTTAKQNRRSGARRAALGAVGALLCLVAGIEMVAAQGMLLPGKFDVSPTGAATYNIPIVMPPGTAGMVPSLSLDYSSQGANGIVGVGWSLSGLPAMGRCPRTIAQDGVRGAINYDANDRFCLDGQRLIAVSGAYGGDGTEYRTEIDGYSRIVSHGVAGNGPAWFEVRTKSGQIMEFGNTTDSRALPQNTATVRVWGVNKVSDTKGNYLTVTYVNDTVNGESYPARINYTGNANTGLTPNVTVQFLYAARSDVTRFYQAGSAITSTAILSKVQTFIGSAQVLEYRLAYETGSATQRSRLTSVTLCNVSQECLPATTFNWVNGGAAFEPAGVVGTGFGDNVPAADPRYFVVDVNGDGKQDMVLRSGDGVFATYLSNGATFSFAGQSPLGWGDNVPVADQRYFVADINGDGKQDFLARDSDGTLSIYLSNGATFAHSDLIPTGYGDNAPVHDRRFFVMDVNGDGKQDFVIRGADGYLHVYLSNGATLVYSGATLTGYGDNIAVADERYFVMDVNGDGKQDFVIRGADGYLYVYVSNGTTFTYGSAIYTGYGDNVPVADKRYFVMDVNGDGNEDFVIRGADGYLYVYLANGITFTYAGAVVTGYGDNISIADQRYFVMDVNGDGKQDFVIRSGAGEFLVYLSNGTTFIYGGLVGTGFGDNVATHDRRYFVADVNGDGRHDFLIRGTDGNVFMYLSNGTTFTYGGSVATSFGDNVPVADQRYFLMDINGDGSSEDLVFRDSNGALNIFTASGQPDIISSITAGTGVSVAITYQPLANNTIYVKETSAVYPIVDMQGSVYVVSRTDTGNGIGGTYASNYIYAGAKADVSGRGFLGFHQVFVMDPQTGVVKTTNYRQDFPFIGLVDSAQKAVGPQMLNQTASVYQLLNNSGGGTVSAASTTSAPYRVQLSQSADRSWDLDGSAIPDLTTSYQYDAFGNATQIVAATPDGAVKTTTNAYFNDTARWFLGRLTSATVTSSQP